MDFVFKLFLILHIIGGFLGLITGMINMLRKKGDKIHLFMGKIFFISMLTTGISSLILSILHPNSFLLLIGIFTLYMVVSGQLYIKHNFSRYSKHIILIISIMMSLAGVFFIYFGVLTLLNTNLSGLVFLTFGGLGLLFVYQDFINYMGQSAVKNYWLVAHIQRMTGGFIAALTAFLVVNANYFPEYIPAILFWLLPTIVFSILIINWSRKYALKEKASRVSKKV